MQAHRPEAEAATQRRPAISAAVERAVLTRQGHVCNTCGLPLGSLYDLDHVIPRCFRPVDAPEALQALCVECHAKKTRLDEPRLIAAHKRDDARVCWARCKRIVHPRDYDAGHLACRECAAALAAEASAAAELEAAVRDAAAKTPAAARLAWLETCRYTPALSHTPAPPSPPHPPSPPPPLLSSHPPLPHPRGLESLRSVPSLVAPLPPRVQVDTTTTRAKTIQTIDGRSPYFCASYPKT